MARSKKQLENQMRLVAVAAVAKEFRKSAIIAKIISIAKSKGMVATGKLTNPKSSKSLMPESDDRWLVKKDSIRVVIGSYKNNIPESVKIITNIEYGLGPDHQYYSVLWEKSKKKKWYPKIDPIQSWVMKKGISSDIRESRRIAFRIAKSMGKNGIKKRTNFLNPFEYKDKGFDATLQRGINNAAARMIDLYGETLIEAIDTSLLKVFK